MNEGVKSKWITGLAIALLILSIIFMAGKVGSFFSGIYHIGQKVLTPFFVGLVIAYLLNPIVNFLSRHHFPRWLAVLLIYILFFALLFFSILKGGPIIYREFRELSERIPDLVVSLRSWAREMDLQQSILPFSIHGGVTHGMNTLGAAVTGYFTGLFTNINSLLEKLLIYFLIPFIVFYLLKDMKTMHRGILMLFPSRYRIRISRILHDIDIALGQYIHGQLTVGLVIGILTYIGYKIIGLPYAGAFAIMVGATDVIPYIGPFIGAAPAMLIGLSVSWKMALYVIGVNVFVQVLEGNVFSPLIVGRTLHMHPLLIIFAVTVGGEIGGFMGLILAIPVVAICKVILQHTLRHFIHKPDMPNRTKA